MTDLVHIGKRRESDADESELALSRRGFIGAAGLTLAGASSALSGCIRKPTELIVPYDRRPEDFIPGRPVYFATSSKFGGQVMGLLVESQDGRPTKIEGNPQHPGSLGATNAQAQASVMDLYNADRSRTPTNAGNDTDWQAWDTWSGEHFAARRSAAGKGVAVLVEDVSSPTLQRLLGEWRSAFPQSAVYTHDLSQPVNRDAGTDLTGLTGVAPRFDLSKADVVVSLDCDFIGTDGDTVRLTRDFTDRRRVYDAHDDMNRLYVVEAALTLTGYAADNRLRLKSAQVGDFLAVVASKLFEGDVAVPQGADAVRAKVDTIHLDDEAATKFAVALADDLAHNKGKSAILVGERQPASVHALAILLNVALGNLGSTLAYYPRHAVVPDGNDLGKLVADIQGGDVDTLVILGGNPVFTALGDSGFTDALGKVEHTVHLSHDRNETSKACGWHLPESHYLEAWGDHRASDGTVSVQQPLIDPMFGTRSAIELLSGLLGGDGSGLAQTTQTWNGGASTPAFERRWRGWLHNGLVGGSAATPLAPSLTAVAAPAPAPEGEGDVTAAAVADLLANPYTYDWSALAGAIGAAADGSGVEVDFLVDNKLGDGRYANNPWLLELPDPITKLSWDNGALISPATARRLGVSGRGGVPLPAEGELLVDKGLPKRGRGTDMVTVTVGTKSMDLVAFVTPGVADDVIVIPMGWGRTEGQYAAGAGFDAFGLRTKESPWFAPASISKAATTYEIATSQDHNVMTPRDGYPSRPLVREATHAQFVKTPAYVEEDEAMPPETLVSLFEQSNKTGGHQWGMSIDLTRCTGCAVCVVACQAENNISVVGKERVGYGREMQWIRIDRYFTGEHLDDVQAVVQPVGCMHCETAPCEQVCPVAATTHSPDGLNDMAYNRCIGTRYCANNCPFKVRRFNYFAFARENDEANELGLYQKNPDVTIRFRGVIEKCSYCVQRINEEKIAAKAHGNGVVPDGRIVPACAQVCPASAIVFGDINDKDSAVSAAKARPQEYVLLSELNIHPRTSYGGQLRNPNPDLTPHAAASDESHGAH